MKILEHLLTEEGTYLIPESELFANGKYTAVYAQSIDINYYDFNGNIIYTAKTTADENRTFVSKDPEDPKKRSSDRYRSICTD